jgi:3-oxoacyl-[acyl-carrier protein] reductase
MELARAGCRVVINGRDAEALESAAQAIRRETGAQIATVAGDVGSADVQAKLIAAADGAPDILVNNNGGPPSRAWRDIDAAGIQAGISANMIAPIAMIQSVIDGMIERRWGRILCITSGSVKMPRPGLDLSSGARLGLHGFLRGVASEVAGHGVTINFLLPGAFETKRQKKLRDLRAHAAGVTPEAIMADRIATIPAGRIGIPEEFGATCAFLCSQHAGFIVGQSLLIDGGANPATF